MGIWDDLDRPSEALWFGAQTLIALLLAAYSFAAGYVIVGVICSSLVLLGLVMIAYVFRRKRTERKTG